MRALAAEYAALDWLILGIDYKHYEFDSKNHDSVVFADRRTVDASRAIFGDGPRELQVQPVADRTGRREVLRATNPVKESPGLLAGAFFIG